MKVLIQELYMILRRHFCKSPNDAASENGGMGEENGGGGRSECRPNTIRTLS